MSDTPALGATFTAESYLPQWVQDLRAGLKPAKLQKYALQYPVLAKILQDEGALSITGDGADEGRLETYVSRVIPDAVLTHFVRDTNLGELASHIVTSEKAPVHVTADPGEIAARQDALVQNVILGCLGGEDETVRAITEMGALVKDGGIAVVTVPNPEGREFSTYQAWPEDEGCGFVEGQPYKFQLRGFAEVYDNLLASILPAEEHPKSWMTDHMYTISADEIGRGVKKGLITSTYAAAGFALERVVPVQDRDLTITMTDNGIPLPQPKTYKASDKPAFIIGVYRKGAAPS